MRPLQQERAGNDGDLWEKPVYLRPETSEILAAVESLYADRLKPFGRILLKRVREINAAAGAEAARAAGDAGATVDVDAAPLIDPRCLRRICETCTQLRVEPEDGKEYSVHLVGRPRVFEDVCSPVDHYPPEMWSEAKAYFEGLQGEEMLFPGGRYACACVLLNRKLPFLANRSLGEVCHIVQLAVSQKRLLGYFEGNMVPFGRSDDWIKEQCAVWQQPVSFAKMAAPDMPLATWEETRACLWEILDSASVHGKPGVVTLSNVKRLFRSRFSLELSETALGHSRLNELLQDSRLSDICSMELQGRSQVVVQQMLPPHLSGAQGMSSSCVADYWQASPWAQALDPRAAPWTPNPATPPAPADDFVCLSTLPMSGSSGLEAPPPRTEEAPAAAAAPADEPQRVRSPSSKDVLSSYVQQLMELGDHQKHEQLQALSSYGTQASASAGPAAVGAVCRSRGPGRWLSLRQPLLGQ